MILYLKARDVVANARKAFDEGRLQMQNMNLENCLYAGPCAIGVSIPPALQFYYDKQKAGIGTLVGRGLIETDDLPTLQYLQISHDIGDLNNFEQTLKYLEIKHDLRSVEEAS